MGAGLFHAEGRTDGRTDRHMTKLIEIMKLYVIRWTTPFSRKRINYQTERVWTTKLRRVIVVEHGGELLKRTLQFIFSYRMKCLGWGDYEVSVPLNNQATTKSRVSLKYSGHKFIWLLRSNLIDVIGKARRCSDGRITGTSWLFQNHTVFDVWC